MRLDHIFHQVLKGQSWVLIDDAVIDISDFSQRHPGGRRLLLNAVGTDVTHEMLGRELSVGMQMAFNPHFHTQVCCIPGAFHRRLWDSLRQV